MSRHQRLRRSLRSPVRHGKAGGNRMARQYRRDSAFLAALDAGWLPGEAVPYASRSGEVLWMHVLPLSKADVFYRRIGIQAMRGRLAARGLVPRGKRR